MSFYDLTKDFVLSAKDLFKYRGKRNRTIPSRGGQKDFEPDDSWMQKKALEKFMEERSSVLSEPRVEKLRNLVEGTWDGNKRLVNVNKTGKFWAHMGFTDKRRNWLYPEEALFLLECNTLEIYNSGVPMSVQEAYNMFLGSDMSIEEYQVFSHLRRLGFVVLRHENEPVITPYEKQINLDKYISKKTLKERVDKAGKKGKELEQDVQSKITSGEHSAEASKLTIEDSPNVVKTTPKKRVAKAGKKSQNLEQDVQSNIISGEHSEEASKLAIENPSNVVKTTPKKRVAKAGKKSKILEQDVQSNIISGEHSEEVSKLAIEDPSNVVTTTPKKRVAKAGKKSKILEQDVQSKITTDENSAEASKLAIEDPSNVVMTTPGNKDEVNSLSHSSQILHIQDNISPETCLKDSYMEAGDTSSENNCLVTDLKKSTEQSNNSSQELSSENNSGSHQKKRPFSPDIDSVHEDAKRSCVDASCVISNSEVTIKKTSDADTLLNQDSTDRLCRGVYDSSWESCFISKTRTGISSETHMSNSSRSRAENGSLDESNDDKDCVKVLPLPNIANTDMVVLELPDHQLLPENVKVEKEELQQYDVERYHFMNPPRVVSKQMQREEEEEKRLQGLEFSLPEWINRKPKLRVASWKEYKEKLAERVKDLSHNSPVEHLWKGKVTPLIHPGENWSYQSILDKLSIIQPADNATLLTDSDCMVDVKVTFDVHLPDSRFKKSMPGVPNHRVSVCKCSSDLPGLAELHQVWSRFKDEVPLHWAVVDSGEIAFYVFDGSKSSNPFV